MGTRLAIASSVTVALALLGCGNTERPVAEEGPGAYDSPEGVSDLPPTGGTTEAEPDVAAAPWEATEGAPAGGDAADVEIARKIREQLAADDAQLSSAAKSVEVGAAQGVVTLRGPVESERERELVVSIARSTEGVARVEDHLEIAQR